jgi:hypothetical protein
MVEFKEIELPKGTTREDITTLFQVNSGTGEVKFIVGYKVK